jgi:hypothetical protein
MITIVWIICGLGYGLEGWGSGLRASVYARRISFGHVEAMR